MLQTKVLGLFPNHLEPKPAETQFAPYNFDRPDDDNEFRGLATSLGRAGVGTIPNVVQAGYPLEPSNTLETREARDSGSVGKLV